MRSSRPYVVVFLGLSLFRMSFDLQGLYGALRRRRCGRAPSAGCDSRHSTVTAGIRRPCEPHQHQSVRWGRNNARADLIALAVALPIALLRCIGSQPVALPRLQYTSGNSPGSTPPWQAETPRLSVPAEIAGNEVTTLEHAFNILAGRLPSKLSPGRSTAGCMPVNASNPSIPTTCRRDVGPSRATMEKRTTPPLNKSQVPLFSSQLHPARQFRRR